MSEEESENERKGGQSSVVMGKRGERGFEGRGDTIITATCLGIGRVWCGRAVGLPANLRHLRWRKRRRKRAEDPEPFPPISPALSHPHRQGEERRSHFLPCAYCRSKTRGDSHCSSTHSLTHSLPHSSTYTRAKGKDSAEGNLRAVRRDEERAQRAPFIVCSMSRSGYMDRSISGGHILGHRLLVWCVCGSRSL